MKPSCRAICNTPRRVLVVDDHHDGADSLAMLLSSCGHEVRAAYSGRQALRMAGQFKPQVVLLDIGLCDLNGHAVCRLLRRRPQGDRLLIVAQTGWAREIDYARSAAAGFDHHAVKPVDADELLAWIAGWGQATC